jgi:CRISPR-associated protein Cas8b1/Cst1 subtype I-B
MSQETREINASNMMYQLGKVMTAKEFEEHRKLNQGIQTIPINLNAPRQSSKIENMNVPRQSSEFPDYARAQENMEDLQKKLRQKINESKLQRTSH